VSFTYLLTCVSSPCRHVTCLYLLCCTDTCVIHLHTSELSSNTSVYTNTPSPTHRHPHCHPPSLRWYDDATTTMTRRRHREFHYIKKNCQRQCCSAIKCLSSGINILAGGSFVPLISECKGTDRLIHIGTICVAHAFLFGR